jgi:potassium efflux system protein
LLIIAIASPLRADEPAAAESAAPQETAPNELTVEAVQGRLAKLPENKDLDPTLKTRLTEVYGKTLELLQTTVEAQARRERYLKQAKDVPQALQSLQVDLNGPAPKAPPELCAETTLTEAQQQLTQLENQLAEAQKSLKEWQDEPKRRIDRRTEIARLIENCKMEMQDVEEQLAAKPPADEVPELTAAGRQLLNAKQMSLEAECAAAQAELRFYEAAGELLPIRRDLAARTAAGLEALAKTLRDEVNDRRRREAEQQAREARRVAAQAQPALRAIAERNEALAKTRQTLAVKIEAAARDLESLKARLEALDSQYEKISKRVEISRHHQSIGLLLRKEREELPDVSSELRKMQSVGDTIADVSLELIDYQDSRNELFPLDERMEKVLEDLKSDIAPEKRALLESEARELLQTQRDYLDAIIKDTNKHLDTLVEQNEREQELIDKARQYAEFCDERVMWIRSAPVFSREDLGAFRDAFAWLVRPSHWQSAGAAVWASLFRQPWADGVLLLGLAVCLTAHARLRRPLIELGEQAARGTCRTYLPTAQALVLTVLLALPGPAFVAWIGWKLVSADPPIGFPHALGEALLWLAAMFATLELLRQLCRQHGLGETHFGWEKESLHLVRRGVRWMMLLGLPLVLVVLLTEFQPDEILKNSLGRLAFLLAFCVALRPAWQTTRLSGGVLSPAFEAEPNAWWSRLHRVWLLAGVGGPLCLIGLAIAGYYYTAVQFAGRGLMTAGLVLSLILVYCLLLRWMLVAYRRLGMQRLQLRRAAAEASTTTTPLQANTQLEIKLSDINQQTRRMLQLVLAVGSAVGVWWIWASVVPALEALDHVELWTLIGQAADGKDLTITLADLLLSLAVLGITLAVNRNIPSLLELMLLNRLPLDAGARYATATVARYVIIASGVAVAFSTLGLAWSQVQWLVAAVGVGLGFGLQEIFANFVSGVVLLFERPIRIGDIVTIGEIDGKVTNIHLRATTITDGDERELVVPNKEFITNKVINWTLSSTVSRMAIKVGVAYGTDCDRVRELLLEVARNHPLVLKDPPPHALLDEFGDSTLNFVLRVYMPTRNVYLQLRHELMTQIASKFHEADIEIAFPQREVRIRMTEPVEALQFSSERKQQRA